MYAKENPPGIGTFYDSKFKQTFISWKDVVPVPSTEKKLRRSRLLKFAEIRAIRRLKSVYFKKTGAQSSFLSKLWYFSIQYQLTLF